MRKPLKLIGAMLFFAFAFPAHSMDSVPKRPVGEWYAYDHSTAEVSLGYNKENGAVSYTHLTLPTNREV